MNNQKFNIIAETAFSHEGEIDYLYRQVEESKKGKVDYIKFQVLINPKQSYANNEDIEKIKKWIVPKSEWLQVFKFSKELGLKVITLPSNQSSAKFCLENENSIDAYEIHSVCFNEEFLLKKLIQTNKQIFLGIGGRLPNEIATVMRNFSENNVILMTGFQSFPTDYKLLGLNRIKTLKQLYGCEVGYADHTKYDNDFYHNLNDYAFMNGARYFEKHIVLNKGNKRIDYESGIVASDFMEIRNRLNQLDTILGDGNIFKLNEKEIKYREREKQIVFNKDLPKGSIINKRDLFYKISDEKSDFEQIEINKIIGRKLYLDVINDQVVKYKHIEE